MMRIAAIFVLLQLSSVFACELCDGPGSSFVGLQEHVAKWPQVAIGVPVGQTDKGHTEFRITRMVKGEAAVGDMIVPRGVFVVLPGKAWMLLGPKGSRAGWRVLMIRSAAIDFVQAVPQLPSQDKLEKRLCAMVPWLTHPDPMVAASARKEFAKAPFSALKEAAAAVKPADLVVVLGKPRVSPASRSSLFLLLGAAGGANSRRLARWLKEPRMQEAQGYDALIAAWLMHSGPEGLDLVERLLADPKRDAATIGGAFVRALGFHARNKAGLKKSEVISALCRLLDVPAVIGATLDELVKLKAWSVLEQVRVAYERHKETAPGVTRPVLRYLAAHPGKQAARLHEQIEAAFLTAADPRDK